MEKYYTFVHDLSAKDIDVLKVGVAMVFPDVLVNEIFGTFMAELGNLHGTSAQRYAVYIVKVL